MGVGSSCTVVSCVDGNGGCTPPLPYKIIILPYDVDADDRVDGRGDGGGGRDDGGRRYFPTYFLLFTSYFFLSLIFLLSFFYISSFFVFFVFFCFKISEYGGVFGFF